MNNIKYNEKNISQLNGSDFQTLHDDVVANAQGNETLTSVFTSIYKGKGATTNYMEWLTAHAIEQRESGKAVKEKFNAELKAVQRIINGSSCQKQMQDLKHNEKMEYRVSLTQVKQPMVDAGEVDSQGNKLTKAMVKAKQYIFFNKPIKKTTLSDAQKLRNFIKNQDLTYAKVIALIDALKQEDEKAKADAKAEKSKS